MLDLNNDTTVELFKGLNRKSLHNELINFGFRRDILKSIKKPHDKETNCNATV